MCIRQSRSRAWSQRGVSGILGNMSSYIKIKVSMSSIQRCQKKSHLALKNTCRTHMFVQSQKGASVVGALKQHSKWLTQLHTWNCLRQKRFWWILWNKLMNPVLKNLQVRVVFECISSKEWWQKIQWFPFKHDFTDTTFCELKVAKQVTRCTRSTQSMSKPSSMYESPPGISELKKKDLLTLCSNGNIHHIYAEFYNALTVDSEWN